MIFDAVIFFILALMVAFVVGVAVFYLVPLLFGAPFEPSTDEDLKNAEQLLKPRRKEKLADLGSGTGKVLIYFAKRGLECHGFETNPFLVLYSRWLIRRHNLQERAFVHWKNFWKANLGEFDIIFSFQIGYIMPALEKKLQREVKRQVRVVSNNWKFRDAQLKKKLGRVYLYEFFE
ncbi:hypothetical protein D6817_03165 [Candidatus Pacearchaeota archaeon]|nr:MAG: hypothetical protein D6817_03165 [Candidatus Pacearchaeota archaeon]